MGIHGDIRFGFDGTSDALLESQCGLKRFCVLFTMVSICKFPYIQSLLYKNYILDNFMILLINGS